MIQELRTSTPEQKEHFLLQYEKLTTVGINGFKMLEPYKEFDSYGLKFPIEYLREIGLHIIFLPVEYMAHYADIVCFNMDDSDFKEQKKKIQASIAMVKVLDNVFD